MNICFFVGKIISDMKFKFIINNKKYNSIVIFQIELNDKSVITVKGYNKIADFCYKNLIKSDYIAIYGAIDSEMKIILQNLTLI